MLPDYVVFNDPNSSDTSVLTTPAQDFIFPLSQEDRHLIDLLMKKFDQEENCSGLAAPQIGIGKKAIIFEVLEDPALKKWRPDLEEGMPKSVWLNPSYTPLTEEMNEDYEACFSVYQVAGPVKRYKKIKYKAYNLEGNLIEGTASGFLARVIQHETDHVYGKLFIDYVDPKDLLLIEEYRNRRAVTMK